MGKIYAGNNVITELRTKKMLKRLTVIIIVAILAVKQADAQVVLTTVEDAFAYADAHNIGIRNAGYELDKVLYAKKQAFMAFLPQINANAAFTDNLALQTTLIPAVIFGGPEGVYSPVQFGQKYIYNAGITAQMDIVNLQTWFNLKMVKETEDINRATVANTKKSVYMQIAGQYYNYLLMREAASLTTKSKAAADSVLQSVQNKYDAGLVSAASMGQAKLNYKRTQQNEISAHYQAATALNALKGLLDMSVTDSILIEATLENNMAKEPEQTFSEDPAVLLSRYQAAISRTRYRAANGTYAPTLSVLYNTNTQQNNNNFEPFGNSAVWFPARYWSLRATWNIFSGGTRWVQARSNKIALQQSTMQYENSVKQSAISDENLRLSYTRAALSLQNAEEIMKLSADNYMHISNKYKEGLASLDERLTAFTDYITYQNQYLNSLSDMLVQLYQVKIRKQTIK